MFGAVVSIWHIRKYLKQLYPLFIYERDPNEVYEYKLSFNLLHSFLHQLKPDSYNWTRVLSTRNKNTIYSRRYVPSPYLRFLYFLNRTRSLEAFPSSSTAWRRRSSFWREKTWIFISGNHLNHNRYQFNDAISFFIEGSTLPQTRQLPSDTGPQLSLGL